MAERVMWLVWMPSAPFDTGAHWRAEVFENEQRAMASIPRAPTSWRCDRIVIREGE